MHKCKQCVRRCGECVLDVSDSDSNLNSCATPFELLLLRARTRKLGQVTLCIVFSIRLTFIQLPEMHGVTEESL